MKPVRATLEVGGVEPNFDANGNLAGEDVHFHAVEKPDGYADDGLDDNNTFAKLLPSAHLQMAVTNPEMFGRFERGQRFYADFTPVPGSEVEPPAA